jgi:DNA replication factor GINS
MKLDELRTVQSKERRKDSLQQLRDSFYEDVAAYIQDLKASRDRRAEQVEDPFSDSEVRQLSDELDTAKEVAEAVYERRVGKVVKLASFAAADMPVDDEGMTTEERELFEDLVDRISQNKQTVLDVLSGNGESTETSVTSAAPDSQPTAPTPPTERAAEPEAAEPEAAEPSDSMLADAMGATDDSSSESTTQQEPPAESEPAADHAPPIESTETSADEVPPPEAESEPDVVLGTSTDGGTATDTATQSATQPESTASEAAAEAPKAVAGTTEDATEAGADATDALGSAGDDSDRTTLRITRDVGEIFGVDGREYTLRSEDVVTLPTANADPLVDRDAAMRLD